MSDENERYGFYLGQPVEIISESVFKGQQTFITGFTDTGVELIVSGPAGEPDSEWELDAADLRSLLSADDMESLKEIARLKGWDIATAIEKSNISAETWQISFSEGINFLLETSKTEVRLTKPS